MKKIIIALTALSAIAISASAMSYEQARQQALFLTDKMAYELNLTEEQYEAAYEINLDYLIGVNSYDDVYGTCWTHRNLDLSYVLFDWQYNAFCAASYFYRPIYWSAGYWHFAIYARYPHRDYLYFGRPHFWTVYRGGHSWRSNGGRSWYNGRTFGTRSGNNGKYFGMQDGHKRGDYRNGFDNRTRNNGNKNMGNGRRDNAIVGSTGRPSTSSRSGRQTTSGQGTRLERNNSTQNSGTQARTGTQGLGTRRGTSSGINRNTRSTPTRESSTRTTVTRSPKTSTAHSSGNTSVRNSSSPSRSFSPSRSSGSSVSRSKGSFSGGNSGGRR